MQANARLTFAQIAPAYYRMETHTPFLHQYTTFKKPGDQRGSREFYCKNPVQLNSPRFYGHQLTLITLKRALEYN